MMQNDPLRDFLSAVKEAQRSTTFDVYVPTLKQSYAFIELSVEQQKRLLMGATASVGRPYEVEFKDEVIKIIRENSPELPVDNLLRYDVDAILVQLRAKTNGEVFESADGKYNLTELIGKYVVLDVPAIFGEDVPELSYSGIKVTIGVPTFVHEVNYERLAQKISGEEDQVAATANVIGDVYMIETAKHIQSIAVNDKEFNLYHSNPKDAIRLAETLPSQIFNGVLEQLKKFKDNYEKQVSVKIGKKTSTINVDASFFVAK